MNAIEVTSLQKVFSKKITQKVQALKGISLPVAEGKTVGFIGPNGAGKSTTIKILLGLLTPTSGQASIFGVDSSKAQSRIRVGYLAENPAYYDYLTPRELLNFAGTSFGVPAGRLGHRVAEVLALVGLEEAADRAIRHLSKGMVQRIGMGQTLVHDPDLYILDEPMSGLDPLGRRLFADIILDLKEQGKTVFFSTHIIHDVERICDDVAIILGGEMRFSGSVKEVIDESFNRYEVVLRNPKDGELPARDNGIRTCKEGDHLRLSVPKESMRDCFQSSLFADAEIVSVEPERKTLETIFLEMVRSGAR
ncbi:MAG: ABC transporter ATP-binding protein [Geobacter sp.]|nr:MAG: ABC transporter ATP-binding protein [Geobacter sp.]